MEIEISSTHHGDLVCVQDTRVLGSVLGDITVKQNAHLLLSGSANGNVVFESGSSGEIKGSAQETVTNKGAELVVRGYVNNLVDQSPQLPTRIDPTAHVNSYTPP